MRNRVTTMKRLLGGALLFGALLICAPAMAHTAPDHAEPRVGSTVAAPRVVRIWFDGMLEPSFSTIVVKDANGVQVDRGDSQVSKENPALLEVTLLPLKPGTYRVHWKVVARDGHRTAGDYKFTVK